MKKYLTILSLLICIGVKGQDTLIFQTSVFDPPNYVVRNIIRGDTTIFVKGDSLIAIKQLFSAWDNTSLELIKWQNDYHKLANMIHSAYKLDLKLISKYKYKDSSTFYRNRYKKYPCSSFKSK